MSEAGMRMRIALRYVTPEIWREFLVPSATTLKKLHGVIQNVMGWTNSHLHEFEVRGTCYAPRELDVLGKGVKDTSTVSLFDLGLEPGAKLMYTYDFGDGWEHDVTVLACDRPVHAPECLDGAGACPPEDCGGPPGYASIATSHSTDDPAKFDVAEVNALLHRP